MDNRLALDVSDKDVLAGKDPNIALLLSRPYLSAETQGYHDAWAYLNVDQPLLSHGGSLGGAVLVSQRLSRERIEALGIKRDYEGDDLEDFVEIVLAIDVLRFQHSIVRQSQQMAEAAKKNAKPG